MIVVRAIAWVFLIAGDVIMYPFMWIMRPDGRRRTLRPSGGYYGDPWLPWER